ncbi:hypothetical protein ACQ4N7_27200 [Nodosilinea sp. AN01ver1]|uniref:hypothetical protein n=1 Tax=Nodosilinea sp. AN01ver1 TaxID=3423362 RepID=UPI003D310F69
MNLNPLLTSAIAPQGRFLPIASLLIASLLSTAAISSASAQDMSSPTGLTAAQQVAFVQEHRGQFGGGDQLRRFFFGDLEPISVQPGGAGMVVNLYNKATDTTFAYCATFDVVVAVGTGRVMAFPDGDVR